MTPESKSPSPLLLNSIAELAAHVATLPPTPNIDVWWMCPVCGNKNYGVLLGSYVRCPECRDYAHPPAGMQPKSWVELQIEDIELEIESLEDELIPLQDEADALQIEIDEKRMQIRRLNQSMRRR